MTCPHLQDQREIRKRRTLGGVPEFLNQCQACGAKVGKPIAPANISYPGNILWWDVALEQRHKTKRPATKRAREYRDFMKGKSWKRLRKLVLDRDNYTCRRCGDQNTHHVHHRTYERFGQERLEDLITLCQDCHGAEHQGGTPT